MKKIRGRVSLNRGKLILSGTKSCDKDFWRDHENSIEFAINDEYGVDAQPGGNYKKVKDFLRNKWKDVEFFKLPELQIALNEEYPEQSDYSGFKIQRWGNGSYWENTQKLAIKPLWKKVDRFTCLNIFH